MHVEQSILHQRNRSWGNFTVLPSEVAKTETGSGGVASPHTPLSAGPEGDSTVYALFCILFISLRLVITRDHVKYQPIPISGLLQSSLAVCTR